jgi:hypothetical protein
VAGRDQAKLATAYDDPGITAEVVDVTDDTSIAALAERIGSVDHVVSTASARARGTLPELQRETFSQKADAADLTVLAAVQRPISATCIQQPVSEPGWHRLPTWYLQADQDRMINPLTQAFMAKRMGAQVRPHQVDHAPLLTAPNAVYDVIIEALQTVSS